VNDIETIGAHLAISAVKARYCRALDTKDWTAFAALLTEDFVMDVSEGSHLPPFQGREAAVRKVRESLASARTAHQVHTPEIELKGDEAQVIWAMQDRVVWEPGRAPSPGMASITGYGHYHERYVRRNGEWKLASLKLTRLYVEVHPAAAANSGAPAAA
jgi:hypothetical protein